MDVKQHLMHSFWQGILKFFVLHQSAQSPVYGGKLKKQLQDWDYDISPGSLYPLLHALEKALLLKSRIKIFKGRARKYYEITDEGRAVLTEMREELADVLARILSPAPGAQHTR
jgi:PadR family transcriptional regulator PadR